MHETFIKKLNFIECGTYCKKIYIYDGENSQYAVLTLKKQADSKELGNEKDGLLAEN